MERAHGKGHQQLVETTLPCRTLYRALRNTLVTLSMRPFTFRTLNPKPQDACGGKGGDANDLRGEAPSCIVFGAFLQAQGLEVFRKEEFGV